MAVHAQVASSSPTDTSDEVIVLRSTWSQAVLGKTFRLQDGMPTTTAYRAGKFFVPECIRVKGIRDLHSAWGRVASGGGAMAVRGGLSGAVVPAGTGVDKGGRHRLHVDHVTRRVEGGDDGYAAGLCDAARRWLFLDLDKVANPRGRDPRTHSAETLNYLLSLLPRAIQRTVVSWDWSSSTCIGTPGGEAPRTLSAHIRIWIDKPLAHLEARALLEKLDAYARFQLRSLGVEACKGVVDWKVSEPQQPLYLSTPAFDGVSDPFPGDLRRGLRTGGREVIPLDELMAELDEAVRATSTQRSTKPTAWKTSTRSKSSKAAVPTRHPDPAEGADVVPFGAARRLAEAEQASQSKRRGRIDRDCQLFAARVPLEAVRLVRGRVAAGATDPRWREWYEAGGVPDGQRDTYLFLVGCLIAESMSGAELTHPAVRSAILEVGRLMIGPAWLEDAWEGDRMYASLVRRAVSAGQGKRETWNGKEKELRYIVGRKRLLAEFDVQTDEVARYGLLSLASDRDRCAARRAASGAKSRAETQAKNLKKARRARRMMAKGMSQRAAAEKVGLHEKQLRRILATEENSPKEVRSRPVPTVSADNPTTGREKAGRKEESKEQSSSVDSSPTPAVPVSVDPWTAIADIYQAQAEAARRRGADGSVAVAEPSNDAPDWVREAYVETLEAVADARRRMEARHRRSHGSAATVRAWYDGLIDVPVAQALEQVRARRRALAMEHEAERTSAVARGTGQHGLRGLARRQMGMWAMENRHGARVLGTAWAMVRRGGSGRDMDAPRIGGVSPEWRAAMRDAEGLMLLEAGQRDKVLVTRASEAVDDADREDLKLLHRAMRVVSLRRGGAHEVAA